MWSHAVQAVSTLGASNLNELRLRVMQRTSRRFSSEAPAGGAININSSNVGGINNNIQFGGWATADCSNRIIGGQQLHPAARQPQLQGRHRLLVHQGRPFGAAADTTTSDQRRISPRAARTPRLYELHTDVCARPNFDMTNAGFSACIQDDWKVKPNFKLLYGFATT
jgi:hypothetical protein